MKLLLLGACAALTLSACATSASDRSTARQAINLASRSPTAVYSNAVLVGDTLYLSGKLGIDPETGRIPASVDREVTLALDGLQEVLAEANMTMNDLISVTVFCSNTDLYDQFNAVYTTYFDGDYPARAFVGSGPLLRGAHFEVKGIAVHRN